MEYPKLQLDEEHMQFGREHLSLSSDSESKLKTDVWSSKTRLVGAIVKSLLSQVGLDCVLVMSVLRVDWAPGKYCRSIGRIYSLNGALQPKLTVLELLLQLIGFKQAFEGWFWRILGSESPPEAKFEFPKR